jgi:hypothetical protein
VETPELPERLGRSRNPEQETPSRSEIRPRFGPGLRPFGRARRARGTRARPERRGRQRARHERYLAISAPKQVGGTLELDGKVRSERQ